MKKEVLFIFLLIFLISIPTISAIRINEVEMNPLEGSIGKEWIELYNDENDLDISGWEIWEGVYGSSGPRKILAIENNSIIPKGNFYIIELSSHNLNNNGDFVILYNSNRNKIDETPTLKETSSSSKTWQLCEIWQFLESTKGQENFCSSDEENNQQNQGQENLTNNEMNKTEQTPEINQDIQQTPETETENKNTITFETITLTGKDIKSENGRKYLNKSNYAIYGFIGFCILLGVLFLTKKIKKSDKSEFDEK